MDSSTNKFIATVDNTLHDLQISYTLKPKQLDALEKLCSGGNVPAILLTGYGKSDRHNIWAVFKRHERGENN